MTLFKTMLITVALGGLLVCSPARVGADGFSFSFGKSNRYSLRFTPGTLTLKQGQTGTISVAYFKKGAPRFSRPKDYRISVTPRHGATLRISGGGFAFSSQISGLYKVSASHDSGRAYQGARGTMWIRVTGERRSRGGGHQSGRRQGEGHYGGGHQGGSQHGGGHFGGSYGAYQVLTNIRIFTHEDVELHGHGVATLKPGAGLSLRAVGYDQYGREIRGFVPRWTLSSRTAGLLSAHGATAFLRVGHLGGLHQLTAMSTRGTVQRRVSFRIGRRGGGIVQGVQRIVVHVKRGYYGTWTQVGWGLSFSASRGEVLYFKAVGLSADGPKRVFSPSWRSSSSSLKITQYGNQTVAGRVGYRNRGTVTITVLDPASGKRAQLTLWIR